MRQLEDEEILRMLNGISL